MWNAHRLRTIFSSACLLLPSCASDVLDPPACDEVHGILASMTTASASDLEREHCELLAPILAQTADCSGDEGENRHTAERMALARCGVYCSDVPCLDVMAVIEESEAGTAVTVSGDCWQCP